MRVWIKFLPFLFEILKMIDIIMHSFGSCSGFGSIWWNMVLKGMFRVGCANLAEVITITDFSSLG
jgi:hypothetical protein